MAAAAGARVTARAAAAPVERAAQARAAGGRVARPDRALPIDRAPHADRQRLQRLLSATLRGAALPAGSSRSDDPRAVVPPGRNRDRRRRPRRPARRVEGIRAHATGGTGAPLGTGMDGVRDAGGATNGTG